MQQIVRLFGGYGAGPVLFEAPDDGSQRRFSHLSRLAVSDLHCRNGSRGFVHDFFDHMSSVVQQVKRFAHEMVAQEPDH